VESNGSLHTTGFITNVTCGLTAKKPGSTPCPTLVIHYETTLLKRLLFTLHKKPMHNVVCVGNITINFS